MKSLARTRTEWRACAESAGVRSHVAGMTLVEVMIVAAIISVLMLVAVPAYRSHVLRTHRVEAKAALLAIAVAQEMFHLRHETYALQLTTAPPDGLGLQSASANGHYDLAIARADPEGFEATATVAGRQADDTHCMAFRIDQAGTRSATSADCWSR